jgi:hypothetical protein
VAIDGRYRNTFLGDDVNIWINSSDLERIAQRTVEFETILKELSPPEKRDLALQLIDSAREHLRQYPASCAARARREDAFTQLYEVNEAHFWQDRRATDADFRQMEDYVFAPLMYDRSRTCCWNSSTAAMYEIIMQFNESRILDEASGMCQEPTVFMARGVSSDSDGYDLFRNFAESIGRMEEWVKWSEDESCPQAMTAIDDTETQPNWAPYCDRGPGGMQPGCGDAGGTTETARAIAAGQYDNLRICMGETDVFAFEAEAGDAVKLSLDFGDGVGNVSLSVTDQDGDYVEDGVSRTLSRMGPDSDPVSMEPIEFVADYSMTYYVSIKGFNEASTRNYTLSIAID